MVLVVFKGWSSGGAVGSDMKGGSSHFVFYGKHTGNNLMPTLDATVKVKL